MDDDRLNELVLRSVYRLCCIGIFKLAKTDKNGLSVLYADLKLQCACLRIVLLLSVANVEGMYSVLYINCYASCVGLMKYE